MYPHDMLRFRYGSKSFASFDRPLCFGSKQRTTTACILPIEKRNVHNLFSHRPLVFLEIWVAPLLHNNLAIATHYGRLVSDIWWKQRCLLQTTNKRRIQRSRIKDGEGKCAGPFSFWFSAMVGAHRKVRVPPILTLLTHSFSASLELRRLFSCLSS
jgi:hypothetical protein